MAGGRHGSGHEPVQSVSAPVASFEAALEFARDLIRIPSLSGNEGEAAECVREEFVRLGFEDTRIDEVGKRRGRHTRTGGWAPE